MAKTNISLNVWQPQPTKIYAVQGEGDSRIINVSLLDSGGDAVDLTGASISIYAGLPHGNIVFFSGTIIDALNGQCAFTLPTSVTSAAGSVNLHILAIWPDPKALKAVNITLEVLPSNFEGAVEASDDFSALVDALATVQDIDSRAMKSTQIAGIPINDGITLAQLIAAGLASGTGGKADTAAIADNALSLGGHEAMEYPIPETGTFDVTIFGTETAGTPVYNYHVGNFTKIGKLVFFNLVASISAKGNMSGFVRIGGLPYIVRTSGIATTGSTFLGYNMQLPDNLFGNGSLFLGDKLTHFGLFVSGNNQVHNIAASEILDNFDIRCAGWYFTE